MAARATLDPELRRSLSDLYDEVMWLAKRPNVSPSMARAWYTHVAAHRLKRRIRHFSGKVSQAAVRNTRAVLRLEHHARIQTTLTGLVRSHLSKRRPARAEFIETIVRCENVHIVTFRENYDVMEHQGDYRRAGITLVPWNRIPVGRRTTLWERMLRGKVANADEFRPEER